MVRLHNDFLTADVSCYGASLTGLWLRGCGDSLVLGSAVPQDYAQALCYSGAIVGPVANRIAGASVRIRGTDWVMNANEGTTCLHSGPEGLHARRWDIVSQTTSEIHFAVHMAHGDAGLPGHRIFDVTYSLQNDSALTLKMTAKSDCDTVINLAHHPYWTLDNHPTIEHHLLLVDADRYLPVTQTTLPTGDVTPVDATAYDFRRPRLVPVDQTLDANLCLAAHRRQQPEKAAVLQGATGRRLQINTTEPGLQIYNGSGLGGKAVGLHPGQKLRPFAGIALEPQGWPDAPHHSAFPSILLPAGQVYRQITQYEIS